MKQYLIMGLVALAAIWVSNNVDAVGKVVGPRA